jgi:drug/metabolite transporter (DMT)-like permease
LPPFKIPRPPLSLQEAALVGVTMLWGTTFLIVHTAMQYTGPMFFVGFRFTTAGLLCLLAFHRSMRGLTWREARAGAAIGLSIFLGYGLQTHGLQSVSASQSAFITALYVPTVPLLQWLVLRNAPHPMSWLGIALAFTGLVMLTSPQPLAGLEGFTGLALGAGELASLLAAFVFAAEIILIGKYAGRVNLQRVTVVQLLAGGLLSFAAMPVTGESLPAFSWVWLACALGLGLGTASVLIQLTMNWAQKAVSPTRATLIYAGEPIWGGLVGRLAGELLPALALLGAGLIVLGAVVSELRPRLRRRDDRARNGQAADGALERSRSAQ